MEAQLAHQEHLGITCGENDKPVGFDGFGVLTEILHHVTSCDIMISCVIMCYHVLSADITCGTKNAVQDGFFSPIAMHLVPMWTFRCL